MLESDSACVISFRGAEHEIIAQNGDTVAQPPSTAIEKVRSSGRSEIHIGQSSFALSPIFREDDVVGVLMFCRHDGLGFDAHQMRNIDSIADQISALEAEHAHERLKKATIADAFGLDDPTSIVWGESEVDETEVDEQLPADGPVLAFGPLKETPLISTAGLQDILAKAVHKLLESTEAHVAAVVLSNENDPCSVVALAATSDAPAVASSQLVSRTVVNRVLASGLPLLTLDAGDDAVSEASKSVAKMSVTTVMCVPLLVNEAAVGVLYSATFSFSGKFDHATLMSMMNDARTLSKLLESFGQV